MFGCKPEYGDRIIIVHLLKGGRFNMAGLEALDKLLADTGACRKDVHWRDVVESSFKDPADKFLGEGLVLSTCLVPVLWGMAGER